MTPVAFSAFAVLAALSGRATSATNDEGNDGFGRRELSVKLDREPGVLGLSAALFATERILAEYEDGVPVWDSAGPIDRWGEEVFGGETDADQDRARYISNVVLWTAFPVGIVAVEGHDLLSGEGNWRSAALDVYTAAIAGFLAVEIARVTKATLQRSRPVVYPVDGRDVGPEQVHSFPSGHAANAAAFVSSFTTQRYLMGDTSWPYYAGLGGAVTLASGLLRLGSADHWLSDVITGWALGTVVGVTTPLLTRTERGAEQTFFVSAGPGHIELVARF